MRRLFTSAIADVCRKQSLTGERNEVLWPSMNRA